MVKNRIGNEDQINLFSNQFFLPIDNIKAPQSGTIHGMSQVLCDLLTKQVTVKIFHYGATSRKDIK